MLGAVLAPTAAADPTTAPPPGADKIDAYPIATGHYSSTQANDFYWVFFKTPDGRFCGIAPNGGLTGCDAVPVNAPAGTNQTAGASWAATTFRHSDQPTFTRQVDVLPEGHRLESWGSTCGVGPQGTVTCKIAGGHGFVLSATYAELW